MRATEREIRELFEKALAGDARAYRAFLESVSVLVHHFVCRRLSRAGRPAQDGEDIVQETLIAIHAKRSTYDGVTPVTAWIHGIARYKLIDNLRASRADIDFATLDEMGGLTEEHERIEARLVVRKVLSLLPETLRAPVELMKLHELSAGEASLRTGTSAVTVRVNVHRGLKALSRYCGVDRSRSK